MNDAELVALALTIADSIERQSQPESAGILRQLARRVAELSSPQSIPEARCRGCGESLNQPSTGRRRQWCSKVACTKARRGGKSPQKAIVKDSHVEQVSRRSA